jgi:hypothetical protein
MSDRERGPDLLRDEAKALPGQPMDDDIGHSLKVVRETIAHAREHHARTGEWPADPVLDEVAEIRREIMAEHGNDWRKVLRWHLEQDRLFVQQNPNARFAEKPARPVGASRP